ncbi:energy-coupling factor ABC transporter ATP-binding protein [Propionivibrio soli]|uniref:energy-coupling factor ABC transporter ATP-binding protein n=1 Tax=Propionivibrio soli TaxID=2976531 RepID=UPI0021E9134B|nr:ABC transporter ATP-binding protein [Propionivibrio soli]
MNEPVFELTDVSYAYQSVPALDGVNLSIRRGERIALLGANGSGKSTLLRLLDGLSFANGGSLRAFGEALDEASLSDERTHYSFRRRVGFVFQNPEVQLFNPTVFDELAFGPLQLGWSRAEILQRIEEIAERFSLGHLKNRSPHRLSGGEKKRVALASVMIVDPEVLLLDEPTAALDPESQSEMIRFLAASRNTGRTLIIATHDLDVLPDIADYAYVLDRGRVAGAGTPAEILANEALLRRTRLIHAHWHSHADGTAHIHAHGHGHVHRHEGSHGDPGSSVSSPPMTNGVG